MHSDIYITGMLQKALLQQIACDICCCIHPDDVTFQAGFVVGDINFHRSCGWSFCDIPCRWL
jgi:hypothetical protein